jgi:hypothetical protein
VLSNIETKSCIDEKEVDVDDELKDVKEMAEELSKEYRREQTKNCLKKMWKHNYKA